MPLILISLVAVETHLQIRKGDMFITVSPETGRVAGKSKFPVLDYILLLIGLY
jgi:hypothetical protein